MDSGHLRAGEVDEDEPRGVDPPQLPNALDRASNGRMVAVEGSTDRGEGKSPRGQFDPNRPSSPTDLVDPRAPEDVPALDTEDPRGCRGQAGDEVGGRGQNNRPCPDASTVLRSETSPSTSTSSPATA